MLYQRLRCVLLVAAGLILTGAADAAGAKHPRFKASDDATALLMRLS